MKYSHRPLHYAPRSRLRGKIIRVNRARWANWPGRKKGCEPKGCRPLKRAGRAGMYKPAAKESA